MMNNALLSLRISRNENYILDTNILLHLFGTAYISTRSNITQDSDAYFNEIVKQNKKIFLPQVLVSEFINVCLRYDFKYNFNVDDNANVLNKDFKRDYRNSDDCNTTFKMIITELNKIARISGITLCCDNFCDYDLLTDSLSLIEKNIKHDINDLTIAKIAELYSCTIITNDRDIQNIYHNVITI